MDEEQFEEILFFFMIFMDEDKKVNHLGSWYF